MTDTARQPTNAEDSDPRLRLWDADSHYYEPRDCFTRHIEARYADLAIRSVRSDGTERILVGDRRYVYTDPVLFDRVQRPGSLREMMQKYSAGASEGFYDDRLLEDMRPEYQDRAARIRLMDEQGIEACMMFPALGVCVEPYMFHDVTQTYANIRAFNRFVEEDWGFGADGRIFAAAMMSLLDVDEAMLELDRVVEAGARVVHLRTGPQGGRSPADPHFDRFWAAVQDAGLIVAFHSGNSGYVQMLSAAWSEDPDPDAHHMSAFQWTNFFGDRPIMETLSALVLHNLFGRFPGLQVTVVEHGSSWVPYLLKLMDKMKGMGRTGHWLGGKPEGRPSDIFRRHVSVAPFHEDDCETLVTVLGAERVLLGSDYPHPEGLADPREFARSLTGLAPSDADAIMAGNLRALLTAR